MFAVEQVDTYKNANISNIGYHWKCKSDIRDNIGQTTLLSDIEMVQFIVRLSLISE
jgi:hypothetical protein